MGHEDAHDLADLEHSRAIVLWGKNVAETGVHLIPHLKQARARGVPVVQIDPVHSPRTLALCDRYYPVRPGGDGFLALAVARVLLDEGWIDPDAPSYTDGFDAFAALARRHTVEAWARARGPAGRRRHARSPSSTAGRSPPRSSSAGASGGASTDWRRCGCSTRSARSPATWACPAAASRTTSRAAAASTPHGSRRPENAGARTLLEPLLGEEILRADPKIRVCVVDNGNPVSQLPDSRTVARALAVASTSWW